MEIRRFCTDYAVRGLSGTRNSSRARCWSSVGVVMISKAGMVASFGCTRLETMVARSLQQSLKTVHGQIVLGALAVGLGLSGGRTLCRCNHRSALLRCSRLDPHHQTEGEPDPGACATPRNKPACRGRCVRARDRAGDGGWGARADPRSSSCGKRARHPTSSCSCARLARWRTLRVGRWCESHKCHPTIASFSILACLRW